METDAKFNLKIVEAMSSVYWAQEITILLHLVLLVAMIGSLNIQLFKDHKVHYSYKIATSIKALITYICV